jgi:hypothetical protein
MNSVQSALSSPRFSRILFWIGAAVLAAGIVVLVVKLASRGSSHPAAQAQRTHAPPQTQGARSAQARALKRQSTIKTFAKVDPRAKQALNAFIASAVARKKMAVSYRLAAPAIRHGYTLRQWKKGTIPVLVYPLFKFPKTASYHLTYGVENHLLVDVRLISPPKEKLKPLSIRVELKRFGSGADRRWLVSYLQPLYEPLVPVAQ